MKDEKNSNKDEDKVFLKTEKAKVKMNHNPSENFSLLCRLIKLLFIGKAGSHILVQSSNNCLMALFNE